MSDDYEKVLGSLMDAVSAINDRSTGKPDYIYIGWKNLINISNLCGRFKPFKFKVKQRNKK